MKIRGWAIDPTRAEPRDVDLYVDMSESEARVLSSKLLSLAEYIASRHRGDDR